MLSIGGLKSIGGAGAVIGTTGTFSGTVTAGGFTTAGTSTALQFVSTQVAGENGFVFNTAGARLKFSSGGTLDYLISDGATVISTPGDFRIAAGRQFWLGGTDATKTFYLTSSNQIVLGISGSSSSTEIFATGSISSDTTAVGNIDAGEDTLITYTLAASSITNNGRGVRVTAWGTSANNANAKTLKMYFGATAIETFSLTAAQANTWRIQAIVLRTGAATQESNAHLIQSGTVTAHDVEIGAPTETLSGAIAIKCTGEGVATNDIVQEGMYVEYI